jgi:hypothetical protein
MFVVTVCLLEEDHLMELSWKDNEFCLDVFTGDQHYKILKSFSQFEALEKELLQDPAFEDLSSLPKNHKFFNKLFSRQQKICLALNVWMKELLYREEASSSLAVHKFLKTPSYAMTSAGDNTRGLLGFDSDFMSDSDAF